MEKTQLQQDFGVSCSICGQIYSNHVGSTPCCGALANLIEDGKVTDKVTLFVGIPGEPIKPTTLKIPR